MYSEAQKRATDKHKSKLRAKGIRLHGVYCNDLQFDILRAILKALKLIDLSQITSLDVDEQTKTIRLIEKNRENLPAESESTTKMMGDTKND